MDIRLDMAIVGRGLCTSRAEAQECIKEGSVYVNNEVMCKAHKMVNAEDTIEVKRTRKFVSRGGTKLCSALSHLSLSVEGMTVLDVGSSTGGFTDCLLQSGVRCVIAVDVGKEQLHSTLCNDERVELYDQTDIRDLKIKEQFDLIVVDVSFISLSKIAEACASFSHKETKLLALLKPQFEVGKGNTKKGIVKDENLFEEIYQSVSKSFVREGFKILDYFPSSILGGDGNREFFIYAKKL